MTDIVSGIVPSIVGARTIVVLADCHIHPARGLVWPQSALDAFKGAELIVTLGDMGERSGLDALAAIAPVLGVVGRDDEADPRTAPKSRVLAAHGTRIGCVFDAAEAGLAALGEAPSDADAMARLFGAPVDVLLWASTHVPSLARVDGRLQVNPGSVTLPGDGAPRAFARLVLGDGAAEAEIVRL
jgi:putative phosphoesterase